MDIVSIEVDECGGLAGASVAKETEEFGLGGVLDEDLLEEVFIQELFALIGFSALYKGEIWLDVVLVGIV